MYRSGMAGGDTPARRIQQMLGNSAFDRVSRPLRQSTLPAAASNEVVASPTHCPQLAEELAHAFPSMYRSTGSVSVSTSSSVQSRKYPYNPQRSYTPGSTSGWRPGRSTPYVNNTATHGMKNFVKTVVLVDPEVDVVPKGKRRQQACDDGCVIDMMEFRGDWSEGEVISAIEQAFDRVLPPGSNPKYDRINDIVVLGDLMLL